MRETQAGRERQVVAGSRGAVLLFVPKARDWCTIGAAGGTDRRMRKQWVFLFALLSAQAQTFTTFASLDGANGAQPGNATLVQDSNGNFYGTARIGGEQLGTIFVMNLQGQPGLLRSVYYGANPNGSLMVTGDQTLYGTTVYGASGCGTVFKSTPDGVVRRSTVSPAAMARSRLRA